MTCVVAAGTAFQLAEAAGCTGELQVGGHFLFLPGRIPLSDAHVGLCPQAAVPLLYTHTVVSQEPDYAGVRAKTKRSSSEVRKTAWRVD